MTERLSRTLNIIIVIMTASVCLIIYAINHNLSEDKKKINKADAMVSAVVEVQQDTMEELSKAKADVITYKEAYEMSEAQRKQTQELVEFIVDHPDYCVVIANLNFEIIKVNGNPSLVGWSKEELMESYVNDMIPSGNRTSHSDAMHSRADEGRSGKVSTYRNVSALTGKGALIKVDTLVLFFADRNRYVSIIAPISK